MSPPAPWCSAARRACAIGRSPRWSEVTAAAARPANPSGAKVIVNLAPTGVVPTRALTPHVPLSVREIIADVACCVRRGANLVHLHARDTRGRPTWRREAYARLIGGIRERFPDLPL